MRTGLKIVLIVIAFVIAGVIITLVKEGTGRESSAGPLGIIIMVGFIAGARAIWKYNPDNENKENESDKHQLDKS